MEPDEHVRVAHWLTARAADVISKQRRSPVWNPPWDLRPLFLRFSTKDGTEREAAFR